MAEALERAVALLRQHAAFAHELPTWLLCLNFDEAVRTCVFADCATQASRLREAERALRRGSAGSAGSADVRRPNESVEPVPPTAASSEMAMHRIMCATTRLALGAALEAALICETNRVLPPGLKATERSAAQSSSAARLFNDSALVAVWTSAHAFYVNSIQEGLEEPPPPTIFTCLNAFSMTDFSDLFARRTSAKNCSKEALPLLNILSRCTNPGSRGYA